MTKNKHKDAATDTGESNVTAADTTGGAGEAPITQNMNPEQGGGVGQHAIALNEANSLEQAPLGKTVEGTAIGSNIVDTAALGAASSGKGDGSTGGTGEDLDASGFPVGPRAKAAKVRELFGALLAEANIGADGDLAKNRLEDALFTVERRLNI